MSSTQTVEYALIVNQLGDFQDLKFIDDEKLMLVMSQDGTQFVLMDISRLSTNLPSPKASSYLLSVPYRKKTISSEGLSYTRVSKTDDTNFQGGPEFYEAISPSIDFSQQENMDQFVQHRFPSGLAWTPERIEVNGRRGRRVICVVAKDETRYRIHDLDSLQEAVEARENRRDETDNTV